MTRIHRYIDDPPQFLFWDIDEVAVFSAFLGIGMLTNTLTTLFIIGFGLSFVLKKTKQKSSDGMFLHVLYWIGFFPIKGCPPSYIRKYIE